MTLGKAHGHGWAPPAHCTPFSPLGQDMTWARFRHDVLAERKIVLFQQAKSSPVQPRESGGLAAGTGRQPSQTTGLEQTPADAISAARLIAESP